MHKPAKTKAAGNCYCKSPLIFYIRKLNHVFGFEPKSLAIFRSGYNVHLTLCTLDFMEVPPASAAVDLIPVAKLRFEVLKYNSPQISTASSYTCRT